MGMIYSIERVTDSDSPMEPLLDLDETPTETRIDILDETPTETRIDILYEPTETRIDILDEKPTETRIDKYKTLANMTTRDLYARRVFASNVDVGDFILKLEKRISDLEKEIYDHTSDH